MKCYYLVLLLTSRNLLVALRGVHQGTRAKGSGRAAVEGKVSGERWYQVVSRFKLYKLEGPAR